MKWFGIKKSPQPGDLYEMAQKLHLERRLHPRIRIPNLNSLFAGPVIRYEGKSFPIWDISEGGVCLVDDNEVFRSRIGQIFDLEFFCPGVHTVSCKMVAANLNRKHIQFEKAPLSFIEAIRPWIAIGLRGIWMKDMASFGDAFNKSPSYKMFWASILEDSLVSSNDLRWDLDLYLLGEKYCLSMGFWPTYQKNGKRISNIEFDHILTFLSNIDGRSFEGHQELLQKLSELREHEST